MELLKGFNVTVLSLYDYPNIGDITENGSTFAENAVKKACFVAEQTGEVAMADDSGLEVDYLNGAPGVHSARFAGAEKNDHANNEKLLKLLSGIPPEMRTARFRCVIAVTEPAGKVSTAEGVCEGVISNEHRGSGGFGYDPLFYLPAYGKTFAELDLATKNKISHRSKAVNKIAFILSAVIQKNINNNKPAVN